MADEYEALFELRRVTARRDGLVYKTVPIGEVWMPADSPYQSGDPNLVIAPLSTERLTALLEAGIPTIRKVKKES